MNDKSQAWNDFCKSDKGIEGKNPETLKAPLSQRQYLENRLFWAFTAGWDAAQTRRDD